MTRTTIGFKPLEYRPCAPTRVPAGAIFRFQIGTRHWQKGEGHVLVPEEQRIIETIPEEKTRVLADGEAVWRDDAHGLIKPRTFIFETEPEALTGKTLNPLPPLAKYFKTLEDQGFTVTEAFLLGGFATGLIHPQSDLDVAASIAPLPEHEYIYSLWGSFSTGRELHLSLLYNPAIKRGMFMMAGEGNYQVIIGKERNILQELVLLGLSETVSV